MSCTPHKVEKLNSKITSLSRYVTRFVRSASGVTSIEYGMVVALIAVGLIVALIGIGSSLESSLNDTGNFIAHAGSDDGGGSGGGDTGGGSGGGDTGGGSGDGGTGGGSGDGGTGGGSGDGSGSGSGSGSKGGASGGGPAYVAMNSTGVDDNTTKENSLPGDKSGYNAGTGFTSNGNTDSSSISGGTGHGTSNSISAKGGKTSNPWLFLLIPALGAPVFYFFRKNKQSGSLSRNAKAMNLFVKYSE